MCWEKRATGELGLTTLGGEDLKKRPKRDLGFRCGGKKGDRGVKVNHLGW